MKAIPTAGVARDEVFDRLGKFRCKDLDTKGGRTWAYVYDSGHPELFEIADRAYLEYLHENALDPTVYPSLLQLENEVVGMAASHLRAGEGVVGNFTTGGTESIMMVVKAVRDWARENRPEIKRPNMILPVTAHAAFHKAAHYFDVETVVTPVDPSTWKADVDAMADAINGDTVLLVGSAVSYAHGVVDPIPELGRLALERERFLHVDGCIGGFVLPYFRRLGAPVTDFDFAVPGVSSISMDLHKYAYTPKGASVILYRNADLRRHQLYACASWAGYTVINTTFQSTKSGGALAAAWAVMNYLGDSGYMEIFDRTLKATQAVIEGVDAMEDLEIMGRPESSLVAMTSATVNVFEIVDEMRELGWYVQPQLGFDISKENIHLSVGGSSLPIVPALLADLAKSVEAARPNGPAEPDENLAALLSTLDPEKLDSATFDALLASAGMGSTDNSDAMALPDRTAGINALLNQCPDALKERLLVEYFNRLYVP